MTGSDLTYPEVGATAAEPLPNGYRHVRRQEPLGVGHDRWVRVADGLRDMMVHRLAGIRIRREDASPRVGGGFASGLGFARWRLWAPCRFVWVTSTAGRYGYGFGTVAGHPECGEEAMEVTVDEAGAVLFTVRAFSRPAVWYARLGGPIATAVQDLVTNRYVAAARRLADG